MPCLGSDGHGRDSLIQTINSSGSDEGIGKLPTWPHEKSDLSPDPALILGRFQNGFRYALMENHEPRDRVSIHLNVQSGSVHEIDTQQGLAHFLEHMAFNGSTHFKPGELVKYFQSIGMQFGPDANAHTSFYETVYDVILPKGNSKSIEQGLLVLKDYAEGILLLPPEIDRERKVILAEKRARDSVSYRTYVSTLKFEFPNARISRRLPIGNENVIQSADRDLLKDFYDTWYRPENMVLVMVGDFDAESAVPLIKKNFSAVQGRTAEKKDPDFGEVRHKGTKAFYHFEKEAGKTAVTLESIADTLPEPDSRELQTRLVKEKIANRIIQNRLDLLVSKPDTPFTSADVGSGTYLNRLKYAVMSGEGSPENWEAMLCSLEQTLRAALEYGFTVSELERVKKDLKAELESSLKNAKTRDSQELAREIIRSINRDRVFQSPEQRKGLFDPIIDALTLADIHNALIQIWSPDHRLVLVTGNVNLKDSDQHPENRIISTFEASKGKKIDRPVETKPVVFPYLPEPEAKGRIVNKKDISDLGIVMIDFENGTRLNLKRTDFKADEVVMNISFGSGRSSEPSERPGLAILSEAVINESGLGTLERNEIERATAGKNTGTFFSIGEDRFMFKGKTVSKEIRLLFQLMYAHLMDPGFREDAYLLSMERFGQKYLSLTRTVRGMMKLSGTCFLAGGDSRFGLPPYDSFKTLSLDHVQSWIGQAITSEPLEVSVVGDFDMDSLVEIASLYLGGLPARRKSATEMRKTPVAFPNGQSLKIEVETVIPNSLVVVAYPTEDIWDISRTRRLSVLGDILSDRIRERIREKLGASYSPFAYNRPSRAYSGYGIFQSFVQVDPGQGDLVINEVKKIVADISLNGPDPDDLVRALEPNLTSIKDMMRTNGYWLDTVLAGSKKYPQQIDWSRTIQEDYAAITLKDVSFLAGHYLDNSKAATIIFSPIK